MTFAGPIRGQYPDHVITPDQSEDSCPQILNIAFTARVDYFKLKWNEYEMKNNYIILYYIYIEE